jgi:putative membrane protein
MIVSKGLHISKLIKWSGHHIVWLTLVMSFAVLLYHFGWINFVIPWLPVSVIGTAVAFYVGFKNNQSYSRAWEARKIWGGIVNESRTWGMQVGGFINNQFRSEPVSDEEIHAIKKRLIYRHIAWLYQHREQLLVPTSWEHISQGGIMSRTAEMYQTRFGVGLFAEEINEIDLQNYLSSEEYSRIMKMANPATQLVNLQSKDLEQLRMNDFINDFQHMEMESVLRSFYTLQGRNERIKKFPLPRQYANMSRYFVGIFITFLPFSMIPELMDSGKFGIWLSIPVSVLIGWIYVMMEIVGDYSENPFQGMVNDIPTLSLSRTIEIDLREMLGETDLPKKIESKGNVLM